MKKIVIVTLSILLVTGPAMAQSRRPLERIHAAKMAYITDRLKLTAEQAGNFIPVYTEYEQQVKTIRITYFKKYKGTHASDRDEASSRQYIDDDLDYQQQIIALKRQYNERFLKVVSARQLSELYKAEREFKQKLLKKLGDCGSGKRK